MRNAQRAKDLGFGYVAKLDAMSDSVAEVIKEMYEKMEYREKARTVSQALRDRSNHAMDRIQYWLGYTARHSGEGNQNLLVPRRVSTYGESLQAVAGFLVGVVFTTLVTILFFVSQHFAEGQKRETKKKHRK